MSKKPAMKLTEWTGIVNTATGRTEAVVDIGLIDIEKQVRTQLGDLSDLKRSLQDIGQKNAVTVIEKPDGRYLLIAGERRIRALTELGVATAKVQFETNTDPEHLRRIQVSENNDREDLTAYDEAMGVIEDIEKYGFQGACRIWNRSEGWISKRQTVGEYGAPVVELMRAGLCSDLEVLGSMNQILKLNQREFNAFADRLRANDVLSRAEVRNKVSALKEWKRNAADLAKQASAAKKAEAKGSKAAAAVNAEPAEEAAAATEGAATTQSPKKGAGQQNKPVSPVRASAALKGLREELVTWGETNGTQMAGIQLRMAQVGIEPSEGEWMMWNGFLDIIAPMLEVLGSSRSQAYLKRLALELEKEGGAKNHWEKRHPVIEGDEKAGRVMLTPMPENWTF